MPARKIVLATTNAGKIRELAEPLSALGIEVLGLSDFTEIGEIEETGNTFAENALIKAAAVAKQIGLVAVADDSGLCVDALQGRPGVKSARFADDVAALPGQNMDQRNIRKLLDLMKGKQDRKAHFETCMAAVAPNGEKLVVSGQWPGQILQNPRGANGFGYDPVFFDSALGKAAAELNLAEK
ncbi:MAG: RdgB/HAM1 family non-canonical purine NTP pyrophosphatase, partial [Desulfovibrio sp.]